MRDTSIARRHLPPAAIPVAAAAEQEQDNDHDNQQRKIRHSGSPLSVAHLVSTASSLIANSQGMRHVDAIYATDVPRRYGWMGACPDVYCGSVVRRGYIPARSRILTPATIGIGDPIGGIRCHQSGGRLLCFLVAVQHVSRNGVPRLPDRVLPPPVPTHEPYVTNGHCDDCGTVLPIVTLEKEVLVKSRVVISEHARLMPRVRLGAHDNVEFSAE